MVKYNPYDLLTTFRFDIIIKYIYGKYIVNAYNTDYFKNIYKEHLRVWNGFKEYNNPNKNTFEAFDDTYRRLINDLSNGFDGTKSKIPLMDKKWVLNGAHRMGAALVNNVDVECVAGTNGVDGVKDCSYRLFKNLGLDDKYMDRTTIEYAKLKPNTRMVFLFPSANGKIDKVLQILNTLGKIFCYKSVALSYTGAFNLMRELYLEETWVGNFNSNFSGYRHKQKLCYPDYNPTYGFLVEFDDIDSSLRAKEAIRDLYKIGKHSVHINDTHEETVRLSKLIFNENSIHHLNNMKLVNYVKFENCLQEFKNQFTDKDIDDYCVTASSTLSAYGLREGSDLDYLHSNPKILIDTNGLIHSHNDYGIGRYHLDRDEIIHNPENHFYHRGVKFASLNIIKELKLKRNEPKDKVDIKLINSVL